jgi:RNA polymerase sigma factor (TIGR02999 family)
MAGVTEILIEAANGDRSAQDTLYRLTESELRKLALHWIRRKGAKGQVRTTEVMDDAFLKLMKLDSPDWQHRGHFYAFASRNILCVLIDLLRRLPPAATEVPRGTPASTSGLTLSSLDAIKCGLEDLEQVLSVRHRQVIELRFLGECTLEETAELLSTPKETLSRDRVFRMSTIALAYLQEKLRASFPDFKCLSGRTKGDSSCPA